MRFQLVVVATIFFGGTGPAARAEDAKSAEDCERLFGRRGRAAVEDCRKRVREGTGGGATGVVGPWVPFVPPASVGTPSTGSGVGTTRDTGSVGAWPVFGPLPTSGGLAAPGLPRLTSGRIDSERKPVGFDPFSGGLGSNPSFEGFRTPTDAFGDAGLNFLVHEGALPSLERAAEGFYSPRSEIKTADGIGAYAGSSAGLLSYKHDPWAGSRRYYAEAVPDDSIFRFDSGGKSALFENVGRGLGVLDFGLTAKEFYQTRGPVEGAHALQAFLDFSPRSNPISSFISSVGIDMIGAMHQQLSDQLFNQLNAFAVDDPRSRYERQYATYLSSHLEYESKHQEWENRGGFWRKLGDGLLQVATAAGQLGQAYLDARQRTVDYLAGSGLQYPQQRSIIDDDLMDKKPQLKPLSSSQCRKLQTFEEGWVEYKPGTCQAGGPPPICPVQHWYRSPARAVHEKQRYLGELQAEGYDTSTCK